MVAGNAEVYIAANADGVSQAPFSHYGARRLLQLLAEGLPEVIARCARKGSLLSPRLLSTVYQEVYEGCERVCRESHLHPFEAWRLLLPFTFKLLIVTPKESLVIALDDGYLFWNNHGCPVEERAPRRFELDENIPPLLARPFVYDSISLRASKKLGESEARLAEEAYAFQIVAYGPSSSILEQGTRICSDGVAYSDFFVTEKLKRTFSSNTALPLFNLLQTYKPTRVASLCLLYNFIAAETTVRAQMADPRIALLRDALPLEHEAIQFPALEDAFRTFLSGRDDSVLPSHRLRKELKSRDILDALLQLEAASPEEVGGICSALIEVLRPTVLKILERELGINLDPPLLPLWDDVSEVSLTLP